jgi:hypothetical protein
MIFASHDLPFCACSETFRSSVARAHPDRGWPVPTEAIIAIASEYAGMRRPLPLEFKASHRSFHFNSSREWTLSFS